MRSAAFWTFRGLAYHMLIPRIPIALLAVFLLQPASPSQHADITRIRPTSKVARCRSVGNYGLANASSRARQFLLMVRQSRQGGRGIQLCGAEYPAIVTSSNTQSHQPARCQSLPPLPPCPGRAARALNRWLAAILPWMRHQISAPLPRALNSPPKRSESIVIAT